MTTATEKRHLARVLISGELIANLMVNGERSWIISEGAPDTAEMLAINWMPETRCFNITFQDPSFEPTPEGAEIPILDIQVATCQTKPNE